MQNFEDLKGKTLTSYEIINNADCDNMIVFTTSDGWEVKMLHYQDCCEMVYIEDIIGDLDDLVGEEILLAEEVSEGDKATSESGTWTFYKLSSMKGSVTIRWYGVSNGYYSESVDAECNFVGDKSENSVDNSQA